MLSHLIRPFGLAAAVMLLAAAAGCATPRAGAKVLGVSEPATEAAGTMLVFLEVRNPTNRALRLDRFDYQIQASPWFDTHGQLALSRSVAAKGTAVIEIPVRVERSAARPGDGEVECSVTGTLIAVAGAQETRWPVRATGALTTRNGLEPGASSDRSASIARPAPQ
jgi:hypothetical protein